MLGVGSIVGMRILGFSLVLSVITLYATNMTVAEHGAQFAWNPVLVGLGVGAYGFTLAALQLPLGWLSDRVGRKPVLLGGVALFALGSLGAALAPSIEWLIAARMLEGTGAVSSAAMALLADVVPTERRSTAMTLVGLPVAVALMGGLVIGPLVAARIGVAGIFGLTAVLAIAAELILLTGVREPARHERTTGAPSDVRGLLRDPHLARANVAAFADRFVLMAFFVSMPLVATRELGIPQDQFWWMLLLMILLGAVPMVGLARMADKGRFREIAAGAASLLIIGPLILLLLFGGSCASIDSCPSTPQGLGAIAVGPYSLALVGLVVGGIAFFGGFSTLESLLPALVTTLARPEKRGVTTGVFNTMQFLGSAFGALAGALLFPYPVPFALILLALGVATTWAMATSPRLVHTHAERRAATAPSSVAVSEAAEAASPPTLQG
ncbi:MAG: MFS transporter [Thermoplasmatota archaeon]